jgi:ABC-type uncharacterized transport system permease subunit
MYNIVLLILSTLFVGCATNQLPSYEPADLDEYLEQVDAVAKTEQASTLLNVGSGLIALGALSLVFGSRIGVSTLGSISLILTGAFTVTLPRLWDNEYFVWLSAIVATVVGVEVLIYMGRRLFSKQPTSVDNDSPPHQ